MLEWSKMTKSQWLALILGLFEMIVAVPATLNPQGREVNKKGMEGLLPPFFFDTNEGVYVLAAVGLFLGFQRLQYAAIHTGEEGAKNREKLFIPWVALVFTHFAETVMWYACAMNQPYWRTPLGTSMSARDIFLGSIMRMTYGDVGLQNFVLLAGVPLVAASFAFWGP